MMYFKFLGENREPCNGGRGQWPEPGVWAPEVVVRPCYSGYHLCRSRDLLSWDGPTLWLAEAGGEIVVNTPDKVVTGRARLVRQLPWDEQTARLWAADCAESALHIYEAEYPADLRPRKAIEAARAFACWGITRAGLSAASSAASSAIRSAIRSAAWSAAKKDMIKNLLENYLGLRAGWE